MDFMGLQELIGHRRTRTATDLKKANIFDGVILASSMLPFGWQHANFWGNHLLTRRQKMAAKTERISARVPENVYETLSRAANLVGSTVNQFLVQSALERAHAVIEEENIIRLSGESAKRFFDAIENPPAPNEKLKAAFRAHKERL
jgi:uncharacterized protein (DUF1778 family)